MQKECGSNINQEKYTEMGSLHKVGLNVGKMFGSINKMVRSVPTEEASKELNQKVEELKDKHIDE